MRARRSRALGVEPASVNSEDCVLALQLRLERRGSVCHESELSGGRRLPSQAGKVGLPSRGAPSFPRPTPVPVPLYFSAPLPAAPSSGARTGPSAAGFDR